MWLPIRRGFRRPRSSFLPTASVFAALANAAWSGCTVVPVFRSQTEFVDSVLNKARSFPGYVFAKPDTSTIHKDTSWQGYSGTKELRVVRHRVRSFPANPSDSGDVVLDTNATGAYHMTKDAVCIETEVRGRRGGRCTEAGAMVSAGWSSACPGSLEFGNRMVLVFTADSIRKGTRDPGPCARWSRDRNWFFLEGDRIVDGAFSMGIEDLRKALKAP